LSIWFRPKNRKSVVRNQKSGDRKKADGRCQIANVRHLNDLRRVHLPATARRIIFANACGSDETSFAVLVRTLHPEKRLDVDHVARMEIALIATDYFGKFQKAGIGLPGWPRLIAEIETILARGYARHGRLEEHVKFMRPRMGRIQ